MHLGIPELLAPLSSHDAKASPTNPHGFDNCFPITNITSRPLPYLQHPPRDVSAQGPGLGNPRNCLRRIHQTFPLLHFLHLSAHNLESTTLQPDVESFGSRAGTEAVFSKLYCKLIDSIDKREALLAPQDSVSQGLLRSQLEGCEHSYGIRTFPFLMLLPIIHSESKGGCGTPSLMRTICHPSAASQPSKTAPRRQARLCFHLPYPPVCD